MTSFGCTLSSEEHAPSQLVENARRAEELGFEFASISDHYHPWVQAQGHSPFVWSVLGGIASVTEKLEVGVGVTCPTMRIRIRTGSSSSGAATCNRRWSTSRSR